MDGLLRVPNHHRALAPAIAQRPGRYLGYFENSFGEQLVFVYDAGQSEATLYLGELDWQPQCVRDRAGVPDAGELVLNDAERAFVCACWLATALQRERGQPERPAA